MDEIIKIISDLKAQLDGVQAKIDAVKQDSYNQGLAAGTPSTQPQGTLSQADVDAAVKVAVEKLKADLKTAYDAEQSAESDAEKTFGDLLEPAAAAAPPGNG